ncbi:DUF4167 domain-containing protein [Rhodopseudomonas pseudopalustris]|uniref:DUF4167 domain-containing protein n=2 Tax=Rhodopseudomonas TaxID=1073 RepID=Q13F04_RHOPS|nr:DUF4167 domain-containing protein [Rhodopseudomonas pseudopalustris]ABE37335.1 conserved hypothetical protein [Rhodopseudomonas palustris BisB5]MBB1090364.1 DUF4167 domain-containing protein [Rhodopseudomonas palustris]SEO14644.1 protein of unknown function [Rhodopseudomonas pseudopalustris]
MRNGQNNKRLRNRNSGSNNNNNNNNNRRGQNPMTRVFESNGPDIKIRGTASHVAEKYVQLARDARSSGDPVAAENYYQHAEHYFRLIAAAQEQFRQNQPQQQQRVDNDMSDNDDEGEADYSNFGAEPGLVPVQQQPYQPREQPRAEQPQFAPREQPQPREHRPQPQFTPRAEQPQPSVEAVDRLPSFITGPQPQISPAAFEGAGGAERFPPRRRRRPHVPRGEGAAAAAPVPAEDATPGNE